jgi:PHD/YefM family antitoxin component YafN of YafNO toxin-antitoxin module
MAISASEARKKLFPLIEQVNNDRTLPISSMATTS